MTKKNAPVPALEILKQVPEQGKLLLIRHVGSSGGISIKSGQRGDQADPDETLGRGREVVVPASWAKSSGDLKKFAAKGLVELAWVDENYDTKTMPNVDDAPGEIIGNLNRSEKQFALDGIALQEDLQLALASVNTQVHQPEPRDRMVDIRFMTEKFYFVLKLADWLEAQIQDRPKIHSAIREACKRISDM